MGRTPLTLLPGHPRSRIGRSFPPAFTNKLAIKYIFDQHGNGKLYPCGTKISVYKTKDFPSLSLSHPNILDIYFNDPENGITVCSRRGTAFSRWLRTKRNPIKRSPVDDVNNKPKATSIRMYFREICGDLLKAVCYIHEEGFAIKALGVKNLCMVNGVVKLWKLELVTTSKEALKDNLISLHMIISKILEESKRKIPEDMKSLLALLKSSRMCTVRRLKKSILPHPSLMQPLERLSMVKKLFEMKWYPNVPSLNWSTAATDFYNQVNLDEWNLKYKKKMVGHVLKCFNFRHARHSYRLKVGANVTDVNVVEDFLNFLRDLSYHVGEGGTQVARLKKKHMDAIIFWAFGKEILLFIECLKKQSLEVKD